MKIDATPLKMVKINVGDAPDLVVDWLVAKCEGKVVRIVSGVCHDADLLEMEVDGDTHLRYTADWAQGGPIIEREKIDVRYTGQCWGAARQLNEYDEPDEWFGPTPLSAAMRCYVASKMGEVIEAPKALLAA